MAASERPPDPPLALEMRLVYAHPLGALGPYFAGLREGKAIAARCPACGRTWFPPRLLCPEDRIETEWTALSGRGRIVALTDEAGPLPFAADAPARHILSLVAMAGADNLAFGRLIGEGAALALGRRVRLTASREPVPHPAQAAYFVPEPNAPKGEP